MVKRLRNWVRRMRALAKGHAAFIDTDGTYRWARDLKPHESAELEVTRVINRGR